MVKTFSKKRVQIVKDCEDCELKPSGTDLCPEHHKEFGDIIIYRKQDS